MSFEQCPACGRYVTSRKAGAARILTALRDVDENEIPLARNAVISITLTVIEEVRSIANEMLCVCEKSTALAEVA